MSKKPPMTTREHQPSSIPETQAPANASVGGIKTTAPGDIVDLILRDHVPLKDLIQVLKDTATPRSSKEGSFDEFVPLLVSHAKAEEKTLYVEMKNHSDLRVQSFEGDTGHALADQLVQEINGTPDDDEWTAKVKLLAELVENHIKEEEEDVLPQVMVKINFEVRMKVGTLYSEFKEKFDRVNELKSITRKNSVLENRIH